MDRQDAIRPQDLMARSQGAGAIWDFSKNSHHHYYVERALSKRKSGVHVRCRVTHICSPDGFEFSFRFGKHFYLQVEQLQMAIRYSARQLNTEIT